MKIHGTSKWAPVLALAALVSGCATVPPPLEPKVSVPPPRETSGEQQVQQEASTGQLVKFGHLRTAVRSLEEVVPENGPSVAVTEIGPELEEELASRDFRMFTGEAALGDDAAALSRRTRAQLIVDVNAKARLVNSTGQFSKYRAEGEIRAIRGRDGTLLAVVRAEQMGPRHQDPERAGVLALREISRPMIDELVAKLIDKQNQLMWAGLVVNRIYSAERAQSILSQLEASPLVDYVELLSWDSNSHEAVYEVIYGLRHDSGLIDELSRISGLDLRTTDFDPGSMTVFQDLLKRYKKR